jgi:hypothetical protein
VAPSSLAHDIVFVGPDRGERRVLRLHGLIDSRAVNRWFEEHDPEAAAFEYPVQE